MANRKSVLSVRFKSTFNSADLNGLFLKHLDRFKDVPGLLEKYYISDEQKGVKGGIYIFDNKQSRQDFWNSDLAQSIPATYGVILETLSVEQLEVTIDMTETVTA